ncbi:MAG: T9SS type A sorting domain-containing protein [Paludibacteraceae bacterium]|nr:T9SS type A sorting domain-containing protein [Paludibacteraceae bacterium]MEE3484716.1 T9SS type A sorting domain-containing protein [Bacteroidales bacterium]
MNQKISKIKGDICVLFFSSLTMTASAATATQVLVEQEGSIESFIIYDGGKMYFSDNQLILDTLGNGSFMAKPLSAVNKLQFATVEISSMGTMEVLNSSFSVTIHPNPVVDYMIVRMNQEGSFPYQIYNMNGQVVLQGNVVSGEAIDLSSLAMGVYFIKIEDTYFKFSKL